ncbi:MAG TPA: PQQ-dependent sugar dehydrogenase [Chloroflexaceae bacterium]|nr:PQQ-dependent sugar dehydrogenase [Chloroflexaceae bacterium]
MPRRLAALACLAILALAPAPGTAQSERFTLYLPAVVTTGTPPPPPVVPPPDDVSARLSVPPGFAVRAFAAGLSAPRLMAIGPDDQLYVAERGAGRIVRLPDRDRDGLADAAEPVATGLGGVHSLEWRDGALYAALNDRVLRLRDENGDGDLADPGEQTVIVSGLPNDGGHSTRTARFGPDGMLYVTVGSKCNIPTDGCSEGDPRRAAILRYDPDGGIPFDNPYVDDAEPRRHAVWAEGLRNSVDFLFTADGRLWATHNGSDGLGDDRPPEEIVIEVARGAHHGWPYCYTAQLGAVPAGAKEVRDTRVPLDLRVPSCDVVTPARFTDLAHSAPLGAARHGGLGLPAGYADDLLVAYHGSWNSSVPRDCRVQRIVVEGGVPVRGEPFLTGFRDGPGQSCGGAWGRPAGVTVGPAGEIFVSDDKNGRIYRVVYVGG